MRLTISIAIELIIKVIVGMNMVDSPSPNHAVSEKGMYIFRNTSAKRTENVIVPMVWYLPIMYSGNFLFIVYHVIGTRLILFVNTKVEKMC